MANLTAQQQKFINEVSVKHDFNLKEVLSLTAEISKADKTKFGRIVKLARNVAQANAWWSSEEGKSERRVAEIEWKKEEFIMNVFGWQKSYFYKLVKLGDSTDAKIEEFLADCDKAEKNGFETSRSLNGYLSWLNPKVEKDTTEGEGEGEGEGEEDTNSESTNIASFSFKGENGNVSFYVDADNVMHTTNSVKEIKDAIAFLLKLAK